MCGHPFNGARVCVHTVRKYFHTVIGFRGVFIQSVESGVCPTISGVGYVHIGSVVMVCFHIISGVRRCVHIVSGVRGFVKIVSGVVVCSYSQWSHICSYNQWVRGVCSCR